MNILYLLHISALKYLKCPIYERIEMRISIFLAGYRDIRNYIYIVFELTPAAAVSSGLESPPHEFEAATS